MLSPRASGPRSELARAAGTRAAGTRTCRRVLAFGGLHFELLADAAGGLSLDAETERFCITGPAAVAAPTVATVLCSLRRDHSLPGLLAADRLVLDRHPGGVCVRSGQMGAELRALGQGRYLASARVADSAQARQALLRGLSAAVLELEGGLVLHASGLELDGEAVLLVGPSGAGKSTATRLCEAGRCFAHDHVAVFDSQAGPVAWGLPGGTPPDAPRSEQVHLPLRSVLRVKRGEPGALPTLERCAAADALFVLRESVESSGASRAGEEARLTAVMRLAGRLDVEVGVVRTVLGHSLTTLLRAPRASRASRAARASRASRARGAELELDRRDPGEGLS